MISCPWRKLYWLPKSCVDDDDGDGGADVVRVTKPKVGFQTPPRIGMGRRLVPHPISPNELMKRVMPNHVVVPIIDAGTTLGCNSDPGISRSATRLLQMSSVVRIAFRRIHIFYTIGSNSFSN